MKKEWKAPADRTEQILARHGVAITLGGEPTYVPFEPDGAEWNTTAVGPTKLATAYRYLEEVAKVVAPKGLCFFSPGKSYPGEINPRWTLHLLWRRDGRAMMKCARQRFGAREGGQTIPRTVLRQVQAEISRSLGLDSPWLRGVDPLESTRLTGVLPLDHQEGHWLSARWLPGRKTSFELLGAEGPAGLRLPLSQVPEGVSRRALVLEVNGDCLDIFLPPLLRKPFAELLRKVGLILEKAKLPFRLLGYVPSDENRRWEKLSAAPDPGVLEVNLPACATWREYDRWIRLLDAAAERAGLRPCKILSEEESVGTGGGNHLLFGGPSTDENAFFRRPGLVTSIIRYWQKHPSLSYLFTGHYVGSSSQAPRPDESSRALYDLEMAYRYLENLGEGDHRYIISETLRHLHTDGSGNTHRSEISFDKFWSVNWEGGCRGLIEFRAVETLPHPEWTSAVAALWIGLAALQLEKPCRTPLHDYAGTLHDRFFLPAYLWEDLERVLRDLGKIGIALPQPTFRAIWEWRFPAMLEVWDQGGAMVVRKAHEGWPLLCETPIEGGSTSRFVDTSIERLEFLTDAGLAKKAEIFVGGHRLNLREFPGGKMGAGLRYRRTMLYPSLHPGISPHMPLRVSVVVDGGRRDFLLQEGRRRFEASEVKGRLSRKPCQSLRDSLATCDLRLS